MDRSASVNKKKKNEPFEKHGKENFGKAQGYGSLLIPILKDRLPDDLKIVISRKFGSTIWTLDVLLKYLNEELRAQENCYSQTATKKSERSYEYEEVFSSSGLFTNSKTLTCVFCKKSFYRFS